VLIAGGIGISPMRSILLTLRDREDARPVVLFYAAHDWSRVSFRDEIDALTRTLNLTVVYVFEQPGDDWTGERGFVTADVVRRHLPRQYRRFVCFVCGPVPRMDALEKTLVEIGVPNRAVETERFDMVRSMRHDIVTSIVVLVAALYVAAVALFAWRVTRPPGPRADAPVERAGQTGEALFSRHCAMCHDADDTGIVSCALQSPHACTFIPDMGVAFRRRIEPCGGGWTAGPRGPGTAARCRGGAERVGIGDRLVAASRGRPGAHGVPGVPP
jgi:mono/diheme cytochrome c family protein